MVEVPRAVGTLWLPAKFGWEIRSLLLDGVPYSVRVMERPKPGAEESESVFCVHITFDRRAELRAPVPDVSHGAVGVDTNPHGLALVSVGPKGNLEPFPPGFVPPAIPGSQRDPAEIQVGVNPKGAIWMHVPELRDGTSGRRAYLAGMVALVATGVAKALGKPLALESLDFGQRLERGKGARRFNRLAGQFDHAEVLSAVALRPPRTGS